MIAVQYDPDTDQIWITGEERSYPRRSLIPSVMNDGRIGLRLKYADPTDFKLMTAYTNLTDGAGNIFASAVDAKAYLDSVVLRSRLPVPGPRGPGIFTAPGSPDDSLGLTGDLYIDAESGDLYQKGS